ncbi:VOC family protein [Blastococcus goldschmidtiae]|uniref:VOC family protein n=1 Tax=Blastococcus goldschmidtiae TaxID=3075546 RepID=A0ABU2K382_9ACTN|nr:VOC family protein [Blastococcus sp. DSM 46792]MDT0274645.1 VOC family protein [Blastococcus sp. DSM 46792]
MARIRDVVVDCRHPASLARFWAAVLDGYAVAPYDAAEIARLHAAGVHSPEDDPTVLVEPGPEGGPRLFFQLVPEAKSAKNRLHLDLRSADVDHEIARIARLGGRVQASHHDHVVLVDPEGNEFCLQR